MGGEPLADTLNKLRVQIIRLIFEFSKEGLGGRIVDVQVVRSLG